MITQLKEYLFGNPFDAILKKAAESGKRKFLIIWNRGLGDIPLGLYAMVERIESFVPNPEITFLTRPDLREGFALLGKGETIVSPALRRWQDFSYTKVLLELGFSPSNFEVIFDRPDPTRWLKWQLGQLIPKLKWQAEWDSLAERFGLKKEGPVIGVHVQTETLYNYEKNWPEANWREFFAKVTRDMQATIVLFGFQPAPFFEGDKIIDLRGRTSLIEMMSIIKNGCTHLVAPDSGVLSMTYYLDCSFPLHAVSLWADPKQGVLRQKVPSPNPLFKHYPLVGKFKDVGRIPPQAVIDSLLQTVVAPKIKSF